MFYSSGTNFLSALIVLCLSPLELNTEHVFVLYLCIILYLGITKVYYCSSYTCWEQDSTLNLFATHCRVFDDVVPAFKQWTSNQIKLYIYSSGSIDAQKLLFGNSKFGDLLQVSGPWPHFLFLVFNEVIILK